MRPSRVSLCCGLLLFAQITCLQLHGSVAGAPGKGGKFRKDIKKMFLPLSAIQHRDHWEKKDKSKGKGKGKRRKKPKCTSKHGGDCGKVSKDSPIRWSPKFPQEQRPAERKPFMVFISQTYCHICGRVKKQINEGTVVRADLHKFNLLNPDKSPVVEEFTEKDHEYQPQLRFYTSDGAPMEVSGANPEFPRFFNSEQQFSWAMQRALALEREAQILRKKVRMELVKLYEAHAPAEVSRIDEILLSKEALGKEMEFLESVEAKYGASAQATPQSANPAMESAAAMQSVGESMSVEEAASAKGEAPCKVDCEDQVGSGWGSVQDGAAEAAAGTKPPARASAKTFTTCQACVGAGFGWSPKKHKCGAGFANKQC